jgi:hypothetical protein
MISVAELKNISYQNFFGKQMKSYSILNYYITYEVLIIHLFLIES